MGTRTYSRRSSTGEVKLTRLGREREARAGGLRAINILGETIPDAATTPTSYLPRPATEEDLRIITRYNQVMDLLENASVLDLSAYSRDSDNVLAMAASRRLNTRRWSETNTFREQDAENRYPEVDPIKVESDFGLNVARAAGAVKVFTDLVGDYMTGPGARPAGNPENIQDLLTSTARDFGAVESFLEQVYDMQRKARNAGRKKFNKKEREELDSLMGRVRGRLNSVRSAIERVANDSQFNDAFDRPTVRDVDATRSRVYPLLKLAGMKTFTQNVLNQLNDAMRVVENGMAEGKLKDITNF